MSAACETSGTGKPSSQVADLELVAGRLRRLR